MKNDETDKKITMQDFTKEQEKWIFDVIESWHFYWKNMIVSPNNRDLIMKEDLKNRINSYKIAYFIPEALNSNVSYSYKEFEEKEDSNEK
ncbi:MAG TPA: hypothetical protein VIH61_03270 [Waddliaceae bacterium]